MYFVNFLFTKFFRINYFLHCIKCILEHLKTHQNSPILPKPVGVESAGRFYLCILGLSELNQLGDFTCVFWDCSNVFSIQVSLDVVCVSVCWCREVTCSFSLSCKPLTRSPNVVVSDLPFSNMQAKIKTMICMVFHSNKINHIFFLAYLIH